MGLMTGVMSLLFGDGRNAVAQTVGAFVENADAKGAREAAVQTAALAQYAREFAVTRRGWFDRFIDGINRLPRPALALGTLGLFGAAMWAPEWFAARMAGVALIPEPLWWLMGAIVSFYFGARHQAKGQEFQRSIVQSVAMAQAVEPASKAKAAPVVTAPITAAPEASDNAALAEWWASHGK